VVQCRCSTFASFAGWQCEPCPRCAETGRLVLSAESTDPRRSSGPPRPVRQARHRTPPVGHIRSRQRVEPAALAMFPERLGVHGVLIHVEAFHCRWGPRHCRALLLHQLPTGTLAPARRVSRRGRDTSVPRPRPRPRPRCSGPSFRHRARRWYHKPVRRDQHRRSVRRRTRSRAWSGPPSILGQMSLRSSDRQEGDSSARAQSWPQRTPQAFA
jgi:hypothetical protein